LAGLFSFRLAERFIRHRESSETTEGSAASVSQARHWIASLRAQRRCCSA